MPWRDDLIGRAVLDARGEELGSIDQIYEDVAHGPTTWALLSTGLFGWGHKIMVPIDAAHEREDGLCIPYTKQQVEQAPQVEDPPTKVDADRLMSYFGVGPAAGEGAVQAVAPEQPAPDGARETGFGSPSATDWASDASSATAARSGPMTADDAAQEGARRDTVTPADLADFGGQLAAYGQQLAAYGQKLAYYAQQLADTTRTGT